MSFGPKIDRASQPVIRERETRSDEFQVASIEGQAKNVMDQLRQELGLSRGGPSPRLESENFPDPRRPEVRLSDHFEKIRERISGSVPGRGQENRSDTSDSLEPMKRPGVERIEEGIKEQRSDHKGVVSFDQFDSVVKRLEESGEVRIQENKGRGSHSHRMEESRSPQKSESSFDKFDSVLERLKNEPRIEDGRGLPPRKTEERPPAGLPDTIEERPKERHRSSDTIFERGPR